MAELFDVAHKRVLITGASSGLGAHFAQLLADRGAKVTLAARRMDRLQETAMRINAGAGSAAVVEMDVTHYESVKNGVAAAVKAMGGIDVVLNNSGVARTVAALDASEDDFNHVIDANLRGAWNVAQLSARHMASHGGGNIVNTASILSFRVAGGLSAYAASKAALKSLTESLALEWARYAIRVNAIAPGYIETEINRDFFASTAGQAVIKKIPQRRIGSPSDLDGLILLLVSDAASFMTGSTLVIDGGHMCSGL
jgi:NAD(P)-dependent dehydrogenase (short-subunit alcohol dehydrogenase family)